MLCCLQVSLSISWIFMTLLCIDPAWSVCRDFSPHWMTTGENCIVLLGIHFPQTLYSICIIYIIFLFFTLYPCSFHVLGNAGLSLQQEFYTIERLAEEIAASAFSSLDHVPDHRLRPMIHILICFCFTVSLCHNPYFVNGMFGLICVEELIEMDTN